jgi:hypothetical protein
MASASTMRGFIDVSKIWGEINVPETNDDKNDVNNYT